MSLIKIMNLTFAYDSSYDNIFENVSFEIDTDWKLGFTGRNGRGKTTFLQLLQGEYEYSGVISSSAVFDYFPFPIADLGRMTLEVVGEICGDFKLWELKRELSLLEVDNEVLDRAYLTLSPGEQTKVMLAALFLKENNFLLIDEPTNHLDIQARRLVSDYLKQKKGFILVSHDKAFLDNCIDHILSINRTNIEIQKGNFSSWQRNKEFHDHFEQAENERLKRDIERLSEAARRDTSWSNAVEKTKFANRNSGIKPDKGYIGHKAAKMMKRAKVIEARQQKAIEEKADLLKNIETAGSLTIRPLRHHADRLLEVDNLQIDYVNSMPEKRASFIVHHGERIALCGKNGCGKSSLLKLIMGEDIPYSGNLYLASGLKISYIPQDTSLLQGNLRQFARDSNIDESLFMTILRKLDFNRVQFDKDMAEYSSGQKKKVLIARSLCHSAHLYIWDEPLNYVDIISRWQVEQLLVKYQPTMVLVEHDRSFIDSVATTIIEVG
ncbi:MAG: ribosomal protection-like ABC-F family protein [Methylocystaceae bacterium]